MSDPAPDPGLLRHHPGEVGIRRRGVATAGEAPLGEDHDAAGSGRAPPGVARIAVEANPDRVLGSCTAERSEGGRVASALGQEVAAEAELMRPLAQPKAGELRSASERPTGPHQPSDVLAEVLVLDVRASDAMVEAAELLRALGRVLGDVGRDRLGGQVLRPVRRGDAMDLELVAPARRQRGARGLDPTRPGHGDATRGLADGTFEDLRREVRRRRLDLAGAAVGRIEADERVEVDDPAPLVLGNLGVADAHDGRELSRRESNGARQLAAEVDGRPAPERRRQRVPDDRGLVVEAVRADRLAEGLVVGLVAAPAPGRASVPASSVWAARMARPDGPALLAATVDRPERRRREGDEQPWMLGDAGRDALATAQARGDQVPCVAAVDLAARAAAGGSPVAAGLEGHAVWLGLAAVDAPHLARGEVGLVNSADEPHRLLAVPGLPALLRPAPISGGIGGACEQLLGGRGYSWSRQGDISSWWWGRGASTPQRLRAPLLGSWSALAAKRADQHQRVEPQAPRHRHHGPEHRRRDEEALLRPVLRLDVDPDAGRRWRQAEVAVEALQLGRLGHAEMLREVLVDGGERLRAHLGRSIGKAMQLWRAQERALGLAAARMVDLQPEPALGQLDLDALGRDW